MKSVTIVESSCPLWKRLEAGIILRVPDVEADLAIANDWAKETSNGTLLLLGERVKKAKENK